MKIVRPTTSTTRETTSVANARPRSSSTVATGTTFASAPAPSDRGVALEGTLVAGASPVAVPLHGPGTWALVGASTLLATLDCGGRGVLVRGTLTVGAAATCQLLLSSPTASSWQLTPEP
ncbi:MAG: hypothetical protein KGL79_08645 [Acidobacteriota bacterium]|nr:hypothetical protein [Acidobacteriota bacterium]